MVEWLTRRGGLRAKIAAWVLIPTAVILAGVGALAFYASQRVTEDLVFDRNRNRTQLLANQLSAELEGYQHVLGSLVSAGVGHALYQMQVVLDRGWADGDLIVFDAGVLVLDEGGAVMAAVPGSSALYGDSFPGLTVDPAASRSEALPLTDILPGKVRGMDVIALRQPLVDAGGEVQGTLVGLFHAEREATRTSSFYRRIWELYIGRQGTAYLVDGNGRVIFHPDTFVIGDDLSDLASVRAALTGETGAIRTRDIQGRDVVAGYAPVPRTAWGLVTEELWSDVTSATRPFSRFMLVLLILGVIVPVTVVALGVRRITRPIADLTRAAREVAGGNFSHTIEVDTGDELETLADQFNAMASELQTSYQHLERRVADRTRELSTLNAVSAVVSRSLELDEVMAAALTKTLETMDMEAGAAFRLDDQGVLNLIADHGLSESFLAEVARMPLQRSIAAQAVGQATPVARSVDDYPEGGLKAALHNEGLRSVISVPLVARGKVLGVLNLATHGERSLTPEERSLLAAVGQQAGVAVENASLYEQAEEAAAAAERNRLARELHDAVSQTLFSASMIADVLPRLWERDPEEARRRLADLRRLTRGAMAEMRALLWELRPAALQEAELGELLGQLGKAVAARADLEITLDVEREVSPPTDVKLALYRIAQEALNNVVKHAGANRVQVRLRQSAGGFELCVRDDGRGFSTGETPPGHLGLSTMAERAESVGAVLTVDGRPGQGTEVIVEWRKGDADE